MTVVMLLSGALLAVAALLAVIRATIGPGLLNRAMAMEVVVATVVAGLALEAAYNKHGTTIPIMLALAMVGFVSSVAVARYVGGRDVEPIENPPPGADEVDAP
ncbi:MAG TPA: monovalent cation/H+ antiporter complex subunit F [Jiangellaceae bacterium]